MALVIDNTNLINMCNDCGAVGFVPAATYDYDGTAETVTVDSNATIPAGDTFLKGKIKVHDMFGGTAIGTVTDQAVPVAVDVSSLNRSKPLAVTFTIITTEGIIADGGAYGIVDGAGDIAYWDVQVMAQA